MKIREAEPNNGDLEKIQILIKIGAFKDKLQLRTDDEVLDLIDKKRFWVADNPIFGIQGCCALEVYSPRLAEIRSLYVLPGFRNYGLGSELVKTAVEEAKRLDIQEVLAITDQVSFFRVNGFRRILRRQTPMFLKLK